MRGCHALEDREHDSDRFRRFLESSGNVPVMPGRKNRKTATEHGEERRKRRGLIERIFGKMKKCDSQDLICYSRTIKGHTCQIITELTEN